jgi:large subunit ribosomal protein L7Ae
MTPKPYFVKFETPKEVSEAAYEVLRQASRTGKVRKGTNETTKAVERGIAKLVIIAEDVQPPEVVAHLPIICDEKKIPYVFVSSKDQIGPAIGIDVSTAAAAVTEAGEGQAILDQVTQELARVRSGTGSGGQAAST